MWFAKKYGGYTEANALEFSKLQANSYDIEYNGKGKLGLSIKIRKEVISHCIMDQDLLPVG